MELEVHGSVLIKSSQAPFEVVQHEFVGGLWTYGNIELLTPRFAK